MEQPRGDAAPLLSEIRVDKPAQPTDDATTTTSTAHRVDARRPYRIVCISIYEDDLDSLDARVRDLKLRFPRASHSWLIRLALKRLEDATITDGERP